MKSFFTRLGSLLLCGVAVAMVGCTDFSEDIQAGDNALKDQIAGLTQSTNASVSEINSAIDALEKASQELAAEDQKLAQDLAAAKQALENTIASNKTSLESSISALNTALTNLENTHNSDKTALQNAINEAKSELQGKIDAATNEATEALTSLNAALAALDQAKVNKTDFNAVASDVESLKMGYMQTIQQFQNIDAALNGKADLADFEKTQADLDLVEEAVESLKMGYMQTVEYLTNINSTLATLGDDMDEAQSDIAALKTETAQLNMAIVNLNGAVAAITSRVDVLEEQVAALIQGYQETVAALIQIRSDIDSNAGKIEDANEAIEALKTAHMLLSNELTNFEYAYLAEMEALEAYKISVSKQFEELQAQDSKLAQSILSYYNESINAVDSAMEALRGEYTAAIETLEEKITTEWEKERALIYNTINDIRNTLFAAIEEGDAQNAAQIEALDEAYQLADALIYKTIESYVGILEIAIAEGDQAITEAMDAAVALIYKTIENIQSDLKVEIAEGDAAAIVTMREALDEELALVYKTIASIQSELKAEIAQGDADIQAAMDDAVALIYKTIASTKEEVQAELAEAKNELTATIDDAVALIYKTILNTKTELQSEIADLRNEFTTITDVLAGDIAKIKTDIQNINAAIAGLQEAKTAMEVAIDELQAQDGQLANSIISYYEQAIAAVDEAVADLQAKIDANAEDIEANAEAVANAMIKIGEVETALNTAIEELAVQDAQLAKSILSFHEEALAAAADVANNLETAIGRIDELEDALEALKNLGMEKLEALQNADAALAAKIEEKTTDVMNMLLTVVVAAEDRANDKIAQLRTLVNDAHSFIEELRGEISDLAKRVQSLVYVPEYSDGKANVHYGVAINLKADLSDIAEVAFVPAKTTLRYKVNSTSATIVDEIVKAYNANPDKPILSFDVVGVKVRSAEDLQPKLVIKSVRKDEVDGYLLVDVVAKNFDRSFYLSAIKGTDNQNPSIKDWFESWFGNNDSSILEKFIVYAQSYKGETKGYSAALVLADDTTVNNVASEFTNLVADQNYDLLQLAARYSVKNTTGILTSLESMPFKKKPYVATHNIPSSDTTLIVNTSASQPVIQLVKGGNTVVCTPEELYNKYGYDVTINSHRHIVSYLKNGNVDPTPKSEIKDWNYYDVNYNKTIYNVVSDAEEAIGTSRKVNLKGYGKNNSQYDERVGNWIDVVDIYHFEGQSVAIADKINITKNIVKIEFPTKVNYKWTLQRAIDLRGTNPYDKAIELNKIEYSNIYDLDAVLKGTVKEKTITLNGVPVTDVDIDFEPISGPSTSNGAGLAKIILKPGYEFSATKQNVYSIEMLVDFDTNTDAYITATIALGQLPGKVQVVSETVPVYQTPGTADFKAELPLVKMAYDAFNTVVDGNGKNYIGFNAENAEVPYQVMFDVLKTGNTVVNTPESAYNMNFNVVGNVDKTNVMLFGSQWTAAGKPEIFEVKRVYEPTWFGVPFEFIVPLKPVLPEIALVRSTEYASAIAGKDKEFSVQVQARVVDGKYTVKQSDLANYLNVIGKDAHASQTVKFSVMEGYDGLISNNTVNLEVYPNAIPNPLTGDITARLVKDLAILTWTDKNTQIKIKAQLYSNEYLMDEVVLVLNVADPLSFSAPSFEVKRKIEDDTVVSVFQKYSLRSSAVDNNQNPAHEEEELIQYAAPTVNDLVTPEVAYTYGIKFTLAKYGVFERITLEDGTIEDVLYDDTKYDLNLETGVLTLFKDDAAKLLNPIVAKLKISYEHNVHSTASETCKSYDYEIVFVN